MKKFLPFWEITANWSFVMVYCVQFQNWFTSDSDDVVDKGNDKYFVPNVKYLFILVSWFVKIFGRYLILSIIEKQLAHGWMKNILDGKETVSFQMFLPKIQSEESVSMAVLSKNSQFG